MKRLLLLIPLLLASLALPAAAPTAPTQLQLLFTGSHSPVTFPSPLGLGQVGPLTSAEQTNTTTTADSPTSSSWWNWDARNAPVDPNSSRLISTWLTYAINYPNLALTNWAVAAADSTFTSPCYKVPVTRGGTLDSTICIPLGTKPDPSPDGSLTVRDTIHGRESDFWQAKYDASSQKIVSASSGASFPIGFWTENLLRSKGSGDAASFPLRRGLVTPADIAAGVIDHPLVFSTPQVGTGSPRFPATHNDGIGSAKHLVEGTWLRLDPRVNVSALGLPAWQSEIAVALQTYGMFLRDTGGTLGIYGLNPINGGPTWASVGLSGDAALFSTAFPWSHMQVLRLPHRFRTFT